MAKVQKTFLFPEELAALVDKVIELTGSNFTKVTTAALLQYIFHACTSPSPGRPLISIDGIWTRLVVMIERGEISVAQIPELLLEQTIQQKKAWIEAFEPGRDSAPRQHAQDERDLEELESALRRFQLSAEDNGGGLPAIIESIERCFARPRQ